MCFYRTKLYKACGHSEFRRFMCNLAPIRNNSDETELDSSGQVYIKGPFACSEQPQYLNDIELGLCGHCRKTRHPHKGVGRRRAVLEKEQSREEQNIRIFLPESGVDEIKHGEKIPQQPVIPIFLPESVAKEPKRDDKTENAHALQADAIEERGFFNQSMMDALEEYRHVGENIEEGQSKPSSFLGANGNLREHRPINNKSEVSAIVNNTEHSTKPRHASDPRAHTQPCKPNRQTLSHSATKVRRDLYAAKGRVRSMIQAINGKSEVSRMINPLNSKSMVTSMVNTLNRQSKAQHPAKSQPPVAPNEESTNWPLSPLPYRDPPALSKPEKLQILSKHRYHRLVAIPEESTSQALVVANCPAKTVVLRRAKAIKVRNLNAFHCPVMKPRFGLKRKVLAPPVPRHSTPPVAVPCSKFADLGRRRVSELEWCFVI